MISDTLLALARCPDCGGSIVRRGDEYVCAACGHVAGFAGGQFLDLRPAASFAEQTKYLDEALHADARHETVSPPLLSARIRQDMLRRFLDPRPGDRIVDLGCGSGRVLVWNAETGAYLAGIDVSPYFSRDALDRVDLTLGDLRRLPFADASFSKAYSLDVLEHLSRDALADMLAEAGRVLQPGGMLFVYSHVRKNAPIAAGLRAINLAARGLERLGLIDLRQERLRKSDHLNPLMDHPDLTRTVAAAGFRIAKIRYYTPLVGGFFENIVLRVAERVMGWRAMTSRPVTNPGGAALPHEPLKAARLDAKARLARGGPLLAAVKTATWLMKADLLFFGRIRSGPFFALLVKDR